MKFEIPLPDTWARKPLVEVTKLLKDGTHGTHKNSPNGIPLLSAKDIMDGKITLDNNPRTISEEEYFRIHRSYEIKAQDILVTIVGTLGRVAIVPEGLKFAVQRSVAIIRPKPEICPRFLASYFNSAEFQSELQKKATASAQAGVYLGELSKIQVPVPPLLVQRRIAEVMDSFDESIESALEVVKQKQRLKKSLMQKLFTGQLPVKV